MDVLKCSHGAQHSVHRDVSVFNYSPRIAAGTGGDSSQITNAILFLN